MQRHERRNSDFSARKSKIKKGCAPSSSEKAQPIAVQGKSRNAYMPPMPPAPPAGAAGSGAGMSATRRLGGQHHGRHGRRILQRRTGYLCRVNDAALNHVAVFIVAARRSHSRSLLPSRSWMFSTITRAVYAGICRNLANRLFQSAQDDLHTGLGIARCTSAAEQLHVVTERSAVQCRRRAQCLLPAAARVAAKASSMRSLRSFISTSVAAPTWITATPPASLARRSCSFSRS